RQAPHGIGPSSASATTAMARKDRAPWESAWNSATRSAQQVSPKLALSTLAPVKISPEVLRSAAPTRKPEYGATACERASSAAATRRSGSVAFGIKIQECTQQIRCRFADAPTCFQHFVMRERLACAASGQVRDAGKGSDAHATL